MPGSPDSDGPKENNASITGRLSESPTSTLSMHKTRSFGSLFSTSPEPSTRESLEWHSNRPQAAAQRSVSSVKLENDQNIAASGLAKIRQPRELRTPLSPIGSSNIYSTQQTRSTSMTLTTTSQDLSISEENFRSSQLMTPLIATDDLARFPTESLHSFSFASQSDDYFNSRHSILKRSLSFLREKGGLTPTGFAIAKAQAELSGDPEMMAMIELMSRANIFGRTRPSDSTYDYNVAPLTGPPQDAPGNVFESAFARTPTQTNDFNDRRGGQASAQALSEAVSSADFAPNDSAIEDHPHDYDDTESENDFVPDVLHRTPTFSIDPPKNSSLRVDTSRAALKRTYTDTAPLSLQSKLTDVLAQPITLRDNTLLPPSLNHQSSAHSASTLQFSSLAAHARATPMSQAIFTTETDTPWKIITANDRACLNFGLSKAEVRRTSIIQLFREDKRRWLEDVLAGPPTETQSVPSSPARGASSSIAASMGTGLTARLLQKPSSREKKKMQEQEQELQLQRHSSQPDRAVSESHKTSAGQQREPVRRHSSRSRYKSRGVLLCGDVLPIIKSNGSGGSVTLWVQEKRGALIWVLEPVAEDTTIVKLDKRGNITQFSGDYEPIFGLDRIATGMDITKLIPNIPKLDGKDASPPDYDLIAKLQWFTAYTANDISIPVRVEFFDQSGPTFCISSFPHIAGMINLHSASLNIFSSNKRVTEALFGRDPTGLSINDLIPNFDRILNLLIEEDDVDLVEGTIIPEYGFRRARAMLALREGHQDAAAVFLRPSGLPALHRDGAEVMVDVQMRVLKSESVDSGFQIGAEDPGEVVYALWVTYSRILHAVNHGVGRVSPLISRPNTPPQQPAPNDIPLSVPEESDEDSKSSSGERTPPKSPLRPMTVDDVKPHVSTKSMQEPKAPEKTPVSAYAPDKKISDFLILEEMGAGAYGSVKLARPKNPPDSPKVVIKYVVKRRILVDTWTRDRQLGRVPLEIHVLNFLRKDGFRHPNIVQMADFFEDDVNYYIEMVPHGLPGMDLFDYIELRMNMTEDEVKTIFRQVASAIEFLHNTAHIVHRDIKDENVILDGDAQVKLVDFGSANYVRNGPFDVFVGTIDYAAPEVLTGSSYSGLEQDIWALGILLYTIIYKENPFYSTDEIMDHELRVPWLLSEGSIALIRRMLDRDVDARCNISSVVENPWLKSSDTNSVDASSSNEARDVSSNSGAHAATTMAAAVT